MSFFIVLSADLNTVYGFATNWAAAKRAANSDANAQIFKIKADKHARVWAKEDK
jgi:hypothetical protein